MSIEWSEIAEKLNAGKIDDAIDQLEVLRAKGVHESIVALGIAYEKKGQTMGEPFWGKALQRYREAVERYDDPTAHLGLTRLHYYGLGVMQDYSKAFAHAKRAEPKTRSMSAMFVAEMLLNGLGTPQDVSRAIEFFEIAAKNGYAYGWVGLARCARVQARVWYALLCQYRAIVAVVGLVFRNDSERLFGVSKKYGVIARNCWRNSLDSSED